MSRGIKTRVLFMNKLFLDYTFFLLSGLSRATEIADTVQSKMLNLNHNKVPIQKYYMLVFSYS